MQVEIISCFQRRKISLCLNSIATKIKETTIIVKRNQTAEEDERGIFYINGTKVDLKTERSVTIGVSGTCSLKIKRVNKSCRKFRLKSSSLGLNFLIRWFDDRIFGTFNVSRKMTCLFPPTGLCGTPLTECSDTSSFPCGLNNLTIQNELTDFKVPDNESILSLAGMKTVISGLGPGNCVCFNDGSMISQNLKIFKKTSSTVEFFVKTCKYKSCLGTMFSYTWGPTFTLRNYYGELIVTVGDQWENTGLMLENKLWNQVSISEAYGYADVYVFNSKGKFRRKMLNFTNYYPMFPSEGTLSLGKWQPSSDGSGIQPSREHFVGCIDELRIWDK